MILRQFFFKKYFPLNKIEIDQKSLIHNYKYLSRINRRVKVAPVLKSNAYGHGIVQVAKILDQLGAPFFCVDSIYEAYQLLKAKIKTKILVMGYINPENLKVKKLPFSYAVYDLELLAAISKYQKGASVHIKVDTGMHRLGVPVDELSEFLVEVKKYKDVKVDGLMSHFAEGDVVKSELSKKQLNNFNRAKQIFTKNGFSLKYTHIAASDGLINIKNIGKVSNIARCGIGVYGLTENTYLKPALTLKTHIIQIKNIKRGDSVGYGSTFIAKDHIKLGLLPIGYNDGVDRRLSNVGSVKVSGILCPIIGRVSMNITTIDLTKVKSAVLGQEVIVFSNISDEINSLLKSAELCKTIPHDLLIHLHTSIRREVV